MNPRKDFLINTSKSYLDWYKTAFPKRLLSPIWQETLLSELASEEHLRKISDFIESVCKKKSNEVPDEALLGRVAESDCHKACRFIEDPNIDVNQRSLFYGNTPLFLAVCKGWNHINTDCSYDLGSTPAQQLIIQALLKRDDLEINAVDFLYLMTPLHIACLRGDSPELIRLLIAKGADVNAKDIHGKKPMDYLSASTATIKEIINTLTGGVANIFIMEPSGTNVKYSLAYCKFGSVIRTDGTGPSYAANQSYIATIPTEQERTENIIEIRKILMSNATCNITGSSSTLFQNTVAVATESKKNKVDSSPAAPPP